MTLLPVLLLASCGLGVFLILAGQRDPLKRRINDRLDAIRDDSLDDPAEMPHLGTHLSGWDGVLFGTIQQEARLVEGTIGPAHVLAFVLCLWTASAIAFWFGDWRWVAASSVIGLVIGRRAVTFFAKRSYRQFLENFPAYLDRIRKLVESGNSLDLAMNKALSYANPRVVRFIAPALRRHDLGMPLAAALDVQAKRLGITEISQLSLVAYVISRYGGSLRDSMAHIAQVERDRIRAKRELETLTAEVRASAKVFVALPLLVAGAIFVVHPSYMSFFVNDPSGPVILACGGVLLLIGLVSMRRMSRIE